MTHDYGGGGPDKAPAVGSEQVGTEERMLIIHRLHSILRPFMLRRVKSEVLGQLPEKTESVLRCHLSGWQSVLYRHIQAAGQDAIGGGDGNGGGRGTMRGMSNIIMQLRKVCNHPFLFLNSWNIVVFDM